MILVLFGYHLLFYKNFYSNPFKMCTSELVSTFFPFWRWSKGIKLKDNLYFKYPACIPFLSCFYPPNILTSWISRFLDLNTSFILFCFAILLHSFLASILWYIYLIKTFSSLIALVGAVTLTYSAYFIKPFTPCAMYSMAWAGGMLCGSWLGIVSFGLAILGGYWPTLVYLIPVAAFLHPEILWGLILALPQIIPFIWYWPKSVRYKQKFDKKIGRVPLWRYLDLIFPNRTQNTINGIFWPEMAMYLGLIPLFIFTEGFPSKLLSIWTISLLISLVFTIQRIPARSLYLFSISLIMMSLVALRSLRLNDHFMIAILFLQGFLLLQNADIYPHFPFCQWWRKPKEWIQYAYWPSFKAYLLGIPGIYEGSFCLKQSIKQT